jgi:nitroreductase
MNFFELIEQRKSVRAYLDQPIEDEKLEAILAAANKAPSAGNLQAYEIFLVADQKNRQALAQAAGGQEFITQAPAALVFCTHASRNEWRYRQRGVELYAVQDATIACTFAMLVATALGLASVWVGAFDDKGVSQVIGVGQDLRPVAILPIGYAAESPDPKNRRDIGDIVHRL